MENFGVFFYFTFIFILSPIVRPKVRKYILREPYETSFCLLTIKLSYNKIMPGDNSDIVATDSQKNTVYLLAKQHGVKNPETFGLLLVQHYLQQYAHVTEAHVHVQEYPWRRINYTKDPNQVDHNHAFVFTPSAVRFCDVLLKRDGKYFRTNVLIAHIMHWSSD